MRGDKMWCRTDNEAFDTLGKLRVDMNSRLGKSFYDASYKEEHFQRRVDAINLLYVAFTRAEKNLMIWGLTELGGEDKEEKEKAKGKDKGKGKDGKDEVCPALSGDLLALFLENPPRQEEASINASHVNRRRTSDYANDIPCSQP